MNDADLPAEGVPPTAPHSIDAAPPLGAGASPWLARLSGTNLQALFAVALKGAAAVSALLLQWLIARIYGVEGSGLFALMATTVTLIGVMAVAGQDYIALRNVAGDLAEGRPATARSHARVSVRIAAVGGVLGTVATLAVAVAYGASADSAMMPILVLAAPVVVSLSIGRVYAFVARAGGRVLSSQLPDGPITSVAAVIVLVAAMLIWDAPPSWTLGAIYGVAYCAALAFSAILYRKVAAQWPSADGPGVAMRPILVAGLPLVLGSASPYFSDWLIIFSASAFFSPEVAGQIRIVTLYLSVMYMIFIAFDAVFAPQFASVIRLGDTGQLRRIYWQYALGASAMNLPLVLAALAVPDLILGIFGPEFVAAAPALRLAVAVQAVSILLGPAGTVLIMAHRERQVIWVNAAGLVVLLIGCWWLVPAYGVLGGALVSALVLLAKRLAEVAFMRAGPWRGATREPDAATGA